MKIMFIVFAIGWVLSVIAWGYEIYRIIKYNDDMIKTWIKMWIALAFVWICVFGTKVFG